MKKIIFSLLLLVIANASFGQLRVLNDVGSGAPIMKDGFPDIKGDPFFQDFSKGVILSTKDSLDSYQIRHNAFNNTLEYLYQDKVFAYRPQEIKGFVINEDGRRVEYTSKYIIPQMKDKAFTKVLAEGEYTLIELREKIVVDDPEATYGSSKQKAFQDKISHFIVKDNEVVPYSHKKKALQNIFGDDLSKVKAIEKDSDLNLKNTDHVKVLLSLLNNQ